MPKVTYTGTAGRYFVTDKTGKAGKAGKRWYFPRGKTVDVPEAVAKLLPKSKDIKVTAGAAGQAPDAPSGSEERT